MTCPPQDPILVVGGGMAGLSLAIALCRAGHAVDVVESSRDWNVYGVGIILQSNALRALDSIGLAHDCIKAGYPYAVSRHFNAAGEPLHDRIKPRSTLDDMPASCGMLRPALHTLLGNAALEAGAKVRLGLTVAAFEQDAKNARVRFTDGTEGRYAIVVGADGAGSLIRKLAFGADLVPRFTGQGCWRFTLPRFPEVTSAHMYHGAGGSLAGLVPLTEDLMYLLLLTEEPGNPRMAEDTLPALLGQRLEQFGGLIASARNQIPAGKDIVYRPLEPLLVPAPWARGRVVLIGDAAHATTPHMAQGASMAFEDAVVLADLLTSQGTVPAALLAFSERRHARCRRVVEASVQIGEWQMRPDPAADPIGLITQVANELAQPL